MLPHVCNTFRAHLATPNPVLLTDTLTCRRGRVPGQALPGAFGLFDDLCWRQVMVVPSSWLPTNPGGAWGLLLFCKVVAWPTSAPRLSATNSVVLLQDALAPCWTCTWPGVRRRCAWTCFGQDTRRKGLPAGSRPLLLHDIPWAHESSGTWQSGSHTVGPCFVGVPCYTGHVIRTTCSAGRRRRVHTA